MTIMMQRRFRFLLLAVPLAMHDGIASPAVAADMSAQCPGILSEDVLRPGRVVPGWVTVPNLQHLNAAGMMAGAPETESYLVPDKTAKGTQTWEFAKGGERWFWCGYSGVRLVRRLDDKAASCTITTKTKMPENSLAASVQCK
jgi:hypothetical protein